MKLIVLGMSLLFTAGAFAQQTNTSVAGTLENIERENNVKCVYEKSSIRITNMMYSWHKKYYDCGDFKVSLRVRATRDMSVGYYHGSGFAVKDVKVTKVIYYNK